MTPDELLRRAGRLAAKATGDTANRDPGALDRAIDAYGAARAALPPGDPHANDTVALLGMLRYLKYTWFGGSAAELDEVIALLDELPDEPSCEGLLIPAHAIRGIFRLMRAFPGVDRPGFTLSGLIEERDPDGRYEDVRRAEADLRLAAIGDGAIPERLRLMADGLRMCGDLLSGATTTFEDPGPLLRLADEMLTLGRGPAPFRAELAVITEWARCVQRLRDGEPVTTTVADLLNAVGGLGDEHRVGAVLLAQVATEVVGGTFTNDQRVAARELMTEAWRRVANFTDHPIWRDALRGKAGLDMSNVMFSPGGGDLSEALGLIELLGDGESDEPIELVYDQYLRALSEVLRARQDGRTGEYITALSGMEEALGRLDADHELFPMFLNFLAGVVGDEWLLRGGLKNSEASTAFLGLARERLAAATESQDQNMLSLRGQTAMLQVLNHGEGSDAALDELATLAGGLTERHFLWLLVQLGLGSGRVVRGVRRRDADEVRQGVRNLIDVAESDVCPGLMRTDLLVMAGMGELLLGTLSDDDALIDGGLARLRNGITGPSFGIGGEARRRHALGFMLLGIHVRRGGREYLDDGIAELRRADELIGDDPANPIRGHLLPELAEALHERGDHPDAIETGLAALRAFEEDVLLQTTAEHGLAMARRAAGFARDVAGWCVRERDLEGAVRGIEHGRGLLLGAATSAADAFDVLRGAGRHELADEWQRTQGGTREGGGLERLVLDMVPQIPGDLRYRMLTALAEAGRRPMPEPSPDEIAAALRRVGADALVYLLPTNVRAVATVLVLRADGTLTEVELSAEAAVAAPHDEPELLDWAWTAVVGPLLDAVATPGTPRLVMVPLGALGMIPWHAARDAARSRYACQDAVFSYIASGRQLIEVAGRTRRPPDGDPVLVANPTGDLYWSDVEVKAIGEAFYPFARVYGRLVPGAAGPGRAAEVLAHLPALDRPGASLLELACHARTGASPLESRLELAPGDGEPGSLELGRLLWRFAIRGSDAPGGLVVLSACGSDLTEADHDEALTLATAFLAAGAATVVGTRWPVKDLRTAGLMFMFHHYLAAGRPAADALRAAQLWMLDPGRAYPPEMPHGLREDLEAPDMRLEEVRAWAAFTHQGL